MGRGGFPPSETGSFSAHHTAQRVGFSLAISCQLSVFKAGNSLLVRRVMVDDQEQTREEWEKEFVDVQRHYTFADGLRSSQIVAKKLSATPALIPDFAHLVRLLLGGILLVIGFIALSADIPHNTALGVAILAAACCLGAAAFRWTSKRE